MLFFFSSVLSIFIASLRSVLSSVLSWSHFGGIVSCFKSTAARVLFLCIVAHGDGGIRLESAEHCPRLEA